MSDDTPVLGVAPIEVDPLEGAPASLEEQAPERDAELGPIKLDRQGRKVLEQLLTVEGEIVRAARGVPAAEPTAWRWTEAEVDALMPALEGLAERYGVASTINEHAPTAGAAMALAMHATRSLAAERAWRAAHPDHEEPDVGRPDPGPVAEPADSAPGDLGGPVREPAGEEPAAGLDPVALERVAGHLGAPGVRGGR